MSGFLGKSFWGLAIARGLMVSHLGLASIFPPNVKFNRGDGMEPKGGLVSRGPGGP